MLNNYATDEIIDSTTRYNKRNYTAKERYEISLVCKERYIKELANYTKSTFSFLQDFLQGTVCNNHKAFQMKLILIFLCSNLEICYINFHELHNHFNFNATFSQMSQENYIQLLPS